MEGEFLTIEYAKGDKLYVPVAQLGLVSRYTGTAPELAPLHSLGGDAWERARRKAAEKVRDVAAELLAIYAQREARGGEALSIDRQLVEEFGASFPFEETPDQLQRHRCRAGRPGRAARDGPRDLRRRGFRQDRSRPARGVRRRHRRQAGGRAGTHHPACPAALPQLRRSLRRLAGTRGRALALQVDQGSERRAASAWPTARSTSSSARTSCCSRTSSSRIWAW